MFNNIESTNRTILVNQNTQNQQNLKIDEMSFDDFIRESDKYLNKMKDAFRELLNQDKDLSMEIDPRYNMFIKIHVKKLGTYILSKELETKYLTLTSPISGLFKYKYDSANSYWINVKDHHILEELLVREFCQHSKGLLII